MQKLVPLVNGISNQRYGTYLMARKLAKCKGGLPRMALCSKDVLADYSANNGIFQFWLDEVVARGSLRWKKSALCKDDLTDYSFGWKVPFSYLKDPSVTLGDAFAPGAVLIITPKEFENSRKMVVVHPQEIGVTIADSKTGQITATLDGNVSINMIYGNATCVRPAMMEQSGHVSLPRGRHSGNRIAHFQPLP
jgi:hypothetical protein